MMAPKRKQKYSDDGDSAHWETAREKEKALKAPKNSGIYVQPKERAKKISVADSGRTAKYTGKGKTNRKRTARK